MNRLVTTLTCSFILCMGPGFTTALADTESRSVDTTAAMPTTPDKVIQAFLNDDDLKAWWNVSRSLVEQKAGAIYIAPQRKQLNCSLYPMGFCNQSERF